jgi:nicotinate-nucleotide pyrophosphorylase (carboxylating)
MEGSKESAAVVHDPVGIALAEDIGPGDLTSEHFLGAGTGAARIFLKQPAVVAGVETAVEVFHRLDSRLEVHIQTPSGTRALAGATVLEVRGPLRSILSGERVALNFLQHLSGVATLTRRYVEAIGQRKARILDTRKTVPGMRALEKAAVLAGGGMNHRMGLYDMVMLKDNHLAASGGLEHLQAAISRFRSAKPGVRVEVEADTLQQVRQFIQLEGVDVILLDNMTTGELREAVALGAGRMQFEASGGVTLENVRAIAATGVDFISVGALTHSAPAVDLSLEILK